MDTYFLSHGTPRLAIDDTIPASAFLRSWQPARVAGGGEALPRAILVVSAHWETATPAVNVVRGSNGSMHDFYGFPELMYQLQSRRINPYGRTPYIQLKYPAPGAPEFAKKTKDLLEQAGFGPVAEDHGRGLDHGAWVPLMLMYPAANIPVCQLSVQPDRYGAHHYEMGRALAPLMEDGVLILGSGTTTHNLSQRGTVVGGGVRRLAQGRAAGRQARRCEAVRGGGAAHEDGAPAARAPLPAARPAGRHRGGGAHPSQLDGKCLLRFLQVHHHELIMLWHCCAVVYRHNTGRTLQKHGTKTFETHC
ncbi:4,5-DOPA dioxygenase extradiol [Dichanthelium oligosanthes]|uniref:4,5-DOPA dioxygenase extradiol n=1 Tax=Dichanthelium oligosanthes TaxID=888268 RepID=A0A1E5USK2_9POAL|nr:4,5-DOPA dioxygenase extradiol [Dichanthelium oligosanthes]